MSKWFLSDYFCPNCGKKTVYDERDGGDYYVGCTYLCTSCLHRSYLDAVSDISKDTFFMKSIKEIEDKKEE